MAKRRGTRGSDPLDRDPAAQKGSGLDLIRRVEPRSGGSGRKGARAAARLAGKSFPRRRLAGDAQSGVPVAGLDSGLALGLVRGMRSPLGLRAGLDRGSGGVREGAGGCARRSIAGVRSRGCWGVLQARIASVKVRRGLGGAHRGSETSREAALAGRRRRPATRVTRSSRTGRCGGLPGFGILRFGS